MPKSKPAKSVAKTKKPIVKKADKPEKTDTSAKASANPRPEAKSVKATKILKLAKPAKSAKANGAKVSDVRPTRPGGVQNAVRPPPSTVKLTPFLEKQKDRLIHLRDSMMDSMMGVAKDTLRSRAEGSEASAFGMHQADAGSDAYDRDFALSLLSQEQDALYEIEQALGRIELGTYGNCEMTNKPIAHARLEAIPFARYTVECQSQLEKQNKHFNIRKPVTSLFGLTDEEPGEAEEEEPVTDNKE